MSPRGRRRRYPAGEAARHRQAWLELLTLSGPFLTVPTADRVFGDGLPQPPRPLRSALRVAVAAMLADGGASRSQVIHTMLADVLDWSTHLREGYDLPDILAEPVVEHATVVRPDFAFYAGDDPADSAVGDLIAGDEVAETEDEGEEDGGELSLGSVQASGPWRLLGMTLPWGEHPLARTQTDGWVASPVERLAVLLRARNVPIGLATDGRWWALVWAPLGGAMGTAVWDASLFSEEPESLAAFVALLTRSRFLAVAPGDTLPALLLESLSAQEEVTETLGRQVRDAVELLVATLSRLDVDSAGVLLAGVSDANFYDGVVTTLMRLVFVLFAEERRLLPSDHHLYASAYSVAGLLETLEEQAVLAGESTLEHRTGAWHRLLALARAVHAGISHEDLRLPPYGGGLFDPDRFPWLEGRQPGDLTGTPPGVDDRTVLAMLRAVCYVAIGGERRRLTFRALDVEQIGYVYEGLLELEVRAAAEPILSLLRPPTWPNTKFPTDVPLPEVREILQSADDGVLAAWLAERTGQTKARLQALITAPRDASRHAALVRVAGPALAVELGACAVALRCDDRDAPVVILAGQRYLAPSNRRAATGTHYTPRFLAEDVAANSLEPLVYRPGPLETTDRGTWRLRPSTELLALRVADIAMGSGAFLVASCRYLADRLLDAWTAEGRADALAARRVTALAGDSEIEHVALAARRLVTEHCLYGTDINPLAVEMAKLSLWLVTMDRERPFGFLDDRLIAGDSLLGLASYDQLETLHIDPKAGHALRTNTLFAPNWRAQLNEAADLRRTITAAPVVTIRDVEHKQRLLAEADGLIAPLHVVADAITGAGLTFAGASARKTTSAFITLSIVVGNAFDRPGQPTSDVATGAARHLQAGRPPGSEVRHPLHWPLAFPEVFVDTPDPGFDAILGNPPFLGGQKISGALGKDYLAWLVRWDGAGVRGSADLVARFVLRANRLLNSRGQLGYIATNTLVQGDTLEVGLGQAAKRGLVVRRGRSSHPWPSQSANLEIVEVWASRAPIAATGVHWLDGEDVPAIGADLEPVGQVSGRPLRLVENKDIAFIGSYVLGLGFTLTLEQAAELIDHDPRNADVLAPYVIGQDLNQRPDCSASRWIINFRDWSMEEAEQHPDCFAILESLVKPERDRNAIAYRRDHWWRFATHAPNLYEAIETLDHVLALSRVSNVVLPVRVPTGPVFSEMVVVFVLDDFASLAFLSSAAHTIWVVRYTSTLETRIRYAPSDVFLTLPRPEPTLELFELGEELDTTRRKLMLSRGWGLTTTYNHVHSPTDHDPEIVALRELHARIDEAVLAAYGWQLALGIGHHSTKIGVRWTVSPKARFALLDLLLEENHRRAERERLDRM